MVVRTRRRSRSPAMACARITRATRLWFTRAEGGAPSLSSAVIRGAPWVRSPSWTPRIRSANSASAAARCARRGGRPARRRTRNGRPARSSHSRFTSKAGRWSATKRLTSSSPPRNTSPPGAGCPARCSSSAFSVSTAATCARNCAPAQRRTRSRPIQINSPAAELLRVVLAGRDRGSSRFPGRGRIQRVQDQGSSPGPTTSVSASVLSRVGAAFAAMTAPGPADVGLGSVCPLIIGPRHNEAGIG